MTLHEYVNETWITTRSLSAQAMGATYEAEGLDYTIVSVAVATLGLLLVVELTRHQLDRAAIGRPFYKAVLEGVYSECEYQNATPISATFENVILIFFFLYPLHILSSHSIHSISRSLTLHLFIRVLPCLSLLLMLISGNFGYCGTIYFYATQILQESKCRTRVGLSGRAFRVVLHSNIQCLSDGHLGSHGHTSISQTLGPNGTFGIRSLCGNTRRIRQNNQSAISYQYFSMGLHRPEWMHVLEISKASTKVFEVVDTSEVPSIADPLFGRKQSSLDP